MQIHQEREQRGHHTVGHLEGRLLLHFKTLVRCLWITMCMVTISHLGDT